VSAPAPPSDPNRDEVKHVIVALSIDSPDLDRRFSSEMRALVPHLKSKWRELVAQNGPLESFAVVGSDQESGKQRYHVELDFTQRTMLALVVLEPDSAEVIGCFFSNSPRQPAAPAPNNPPDPDVEELALSVGTAPTLLGASLTLPRERGDARLPAVLLVPGSGVVDRDETVEGTKPFRDIAYGLAHHHIATLRFDKRFFTYRRKSYPRQSAPGVNTVEEELLADAVAAAATLRARPEVDPQRFFVLGHSLGALLAPEIASRSGGVAGLILVAASARPLPELLIEQARVRGASDSDLAAIQTQIKAIPSLPPDRIVLGVPAAYWQDLARRDEIGTARRLGLPIIYLRGELDRNVFAADQEIWTRAFAGDTRYEAVTLPGLSHLLVPGEPRADTPLHVPDAVIARIAEFVARSASARAP
jgi:pimeloyl-ACP methyl ester carboxylesterase